MSIFTDSEFIYVPDGMPDEQAFARTTTLCFSAHQDDIEFMAFHEIASAFRSPDKWFTACVLTDGAGSPRNGIYSEYSDEEMKEIRTVEQSKAAWIGEYAAQIQLGFSSGGIKETHKTQAVNAIKSVIKACRPQAIYTHNLADKHDTHVAVALLVVRALREIPAEIRPQKFYGAEIWRSLDWMPDSEKVVFDASEHPNLSNALMGVYDSQIMGGKRYDLAVQGRRRANATFWESHKTDEMVEAIYAMDMTDLMRRDIAVEKFITAKIDRFKQDVTQRLNSLLSDDT